MNGTPIRAYPVGPIFPLISRHMTETATAPSWTTQAVHEALIRWGGIAARLDDGGRGYPSTSIGLAELRQRPYQALCPTDFSGSEFDAVDAAVQALDSPLKVIVLCYYKPGHLRSVAQLGIDGKGRARSPSIRSIASVMLVSARVIETRLNAARAAVQRHLIAAA